MEFVRTFVAIIFEMLSFAIIGRVLFSWLGPRQQKGAFYQMLVDVTDPILVPFKKMIPPIGMIDISPIVVLILLDFLKRLILSAIV